MTLPHARLATALADRYRLERELGQGGMATVYLAEDLKHKRQVAIKVLKPELAAVLGAERFVQEITTTAALQHPHILPLFDSGEADGFLYYVMPFIDGETLRAKLDRETQLGVEEAVKITSDVADALQYAHDHGVIHRDIKPENILLANGRPMVADFGIALAVSAAAGGRMTETGLSLGTPHYMSPEQATAEKEITARSDVYSLASVCYEMLAGEPPHMGNSAQQIIMKIITDEARPVTALRKSVPHNVAAAIAKALEKLPADRFASAQAFAQALNSTAYGGTGAVGLAAGAARRDWRARAAMPALVVAMAALITAGVLATRPRDASERVTAAVLPLEIRAPIDVPPNEVEVPFSIAPDGSFLVYVGADPDSAGTTALWMRRLDRLEATPIAGTRGAQGPRVAGDNATVYFLRRTALGTSNDRWQVSISGDALPQQAPVATSLVRRSDGMTVYASDTGFVVQPRDATPPPQTALSPAGQSRRDFINSIALSPDAKWVVFQKPASDSLVLRTIAGDRNHVIASGSSARFLANDVLAFRGGDGTLVVGRLAADRSGFVRTPVPLVPEVAATASGTGQFDVGEDGTLVYVPGVGAFDSHLVWVRDGRDESLPNTTSREFSGIALAPDDKRAALSIGAFAYGATDLWMADLQIGSLSPLTSSGTSRSPAWHPDGKRVSYVESRSPIDNTVMMREADGSRPAEAIGGPWPTAVPIREVTWSPDGRFVALRSGPNPRGLVNRDVMVRGIDPDSLFPFAGTEAEERGPRFSPDGSWLLYVSDRTGRDEVYAESFPGGGNRVQLSANGGREGLWSRDGRQVFYRGIDGWMMAAQLTRDPRLRVTSRDSLFDATPYVANRFLTMYDVARDGRFLMLRLDAVRPRTDVVIIRNWVQQAMERLDERTR